MLLTSVNETHVDEFLAVGTISIGYLQMILGDLWSREMEDKVVFDSSPEYLGLLVLASSD